MRKGIPLLVFFLTVAVVGSVQSEPAVQYRKGQEAADQKFYKEVQPLIEKFLNGIEKKDGAQWDGLCHPESGFLFRLLGFYNTPLKCEEFTQLYQETKKRWWGRADGTGEAISGTFKKVWHDHFSRVAQKQNALGVNLFVQTGNAPNQTMGASPFVDLTWKGSEKYGGMDWVSLRLFFTRHDGRWHLTGVDVYHWVI